VADLDNGLGEQQLETLWQSDVIVLVLRLDYTSVRNTRRVLDALLDWGIGVERVLLAANSCGLRRQLRQRQAEEAIGMKITYRIPYDSARANTAVNRGTPIALRYPGAKISKSLRSLAAGVNGEYRTNEKGQQ
jgi:pilus assembly protein CpaE